MNLKSSIRPFYATTQTPCPYIEGRMEQRIVTFLDPVQDDALMDELAQAGFRRSQQYLYRPACNGCNACISVRIPVRRFDWNRRWRKVWRRNEHLQVSERPSIATDEQYTLFRRYILDRHDDGGMAEMNEQAYCDMVEQAPASSILVEMREPDGKLVGVCLTDRLLSGLSGVYKFFAPEISRQSPGSFIILWHVRRALELGLPYVYLGYWIEECRKMSYKVQYRPIEQLGRNGWVEFSPPAPEDAT